MRVNRWNIASVDEKLVSELQKSTGLPKMVCKVLAARSGQITQSSVLDYLYNNIDFESPFIYKDMDIAVERITRAVEAGEQIAVFGDYDCDGITSTALMMNYLSSIGADVCYYIPDREDEGYGMNKKSIKVLHDQGINLIITVDNGITSFEEVDYANELGMDTVITDHHTPRETYPNAVAVVNPHRADCPSRFKEYAGVGVAFMLVCALEEADQKEMLEYYSDLVGIGTVADLMPLKDENRVFVKHGVDNFRSIGRVGIQALLEANGVNGPVTSEIISYKIAPKINAAGRVGTPRKAAELMITDDEVEAQEIVQTLDELNTVRREIEEGVLKEINNTLKQNPEILDKRILIVSGKNLHQGVMGIVASRLLDRFGKPALVFSIGDDGIAKGSGRSIEGFSLVEAISSCSDLLVQFGGHTLAAGVTIEEDKLEEFGNRMQEYAENKHFVMPVPSYNIDCELNPDELSVANVEKLSALAPFGSGNPQPIFVLRNMELVGIYPTADEKHMRLRFVRNGVEINTIYFQMPAERFCYQEGDVLDIVVDMDINEWNGNTQLSVKIKDLRTSGFMQEEAIEAHLSYLLHKRGEYGERCNKEELIPERQDFEMLYRFLLKEKEISNDPVYIWEKLTSDDMDLAKINIILDIFKESGLIGVEKGNIVIVPQDKKVDLQQAETFRKLSSE